MIIKRIYDKKDLLGRNFGSYNKGYDMRKAFKYASRKFGTTEHTSTSAPLRLTGNLLSSIKVDYTGSSATRGRVRINFKIGVNNSQALKALGLQSTTGYTRSGTYAKKEWLFLGISTRLDEDKKIIKFLKRQLAIQSGVIKQKFGES